MGNTTRFLLASIATTIAALIVLNAVTSLNVSSTDPSSFSLEHHLSSSKSIRSLNGGGQQSNEKSNERPPKKEEKANTTNFQQEESKSVDDHGNHHVVSGLDCTKYGGPSNDVAAEMIYWRDIPTDAVFASPFAKLSGEGNAKKYLTFEPDEGGWNNIRMSMASCCSRSCCSSIASVVGGWFWHFLVVTTQPS
jgi:hypothetical protein